ncbi:MAG TPA: NAD(P)H-hydrate epimerase, partial [bacterium]
MKLVTADKMRELDNLTIEKHGVPGIVLMERAGKGAFDLLLKCFTEEANAGIVVVCGGGNNGGDGFVLARYAHENSIPVKIILLAKPTTLKGAALENYQKITDKVPVELLSDAANAQQVTERFGNAGCIVDAIFGTGFRREADGLYKVVIEAINNANRRIIAIDIPSGLNPDTGEAMGCAVRADLTVTFGLPKIGQAMYAAGGCLGRLEVVDIGIPQEEIKRIKSNAEIFIIDDLRQLIKPRKWDAHKGNFGHLMIIAGSHGKTGAAVMVAAAALRTGAGLVTLAAPKSLGAIFEAKTTEAMTVNIEDKRKGFFGPGSIKNLMKALEDKNAIALGPGIGTDPDTASFMKKFLERIKMPAVIDADGLNC